MFQLIKALARVTGVVCLGICAFSANAQDSSNYKISANDVLDFKVFQEADLDAQVRIAGDGSAIFPLVGSVSLAGKTLAEATEILRQRYLNGYLVNPQVSLIVHDYAKRSFTVLGQVNRPGTYDIGSNQSVNLLQAIGMAGGYTRIADPGKITIRRRESGQDQTFRINGKRSDRNGLGAEDFSILPGDVINIAESIF
jgi:protein involved in polysaccharide export with SLBB domain